MNTLPPLPLPPPRSGPAMHILDIFSQHTTTFSFEFFPPKTADSAEALYAAIAELAELRPSFVSVTYGAGGSTRELTHNLVERIKTTTSISTVPHLTCVCHSRDQIHEILTRYAELGINNILALGGDPPRDLAGYDKADDDFQQAADLVRFIRGFEGHPRPAGLRRRRRGVSGRPPRHAQPHAGDGPPQGESRRRGRLYLHAACSSTTTTSTTSATAAGWRASPCR